jgi:hypothetical protein
VSGRRGGGAAWEGDGEPSIRELRHREDGFTPERQKKFLKTLRRTGCVADAARTAGISTTTIDRLRRKFADFDAKCRAARRLAVPELEAIAYRRATEGAPAKIIRKGKLFEVRVKPSDSMLRLLLAGAAPGKYGRFAGLKRPDGSGGPKRGGSRPPERSYDEALDSVLGKIDAIERHKIAREGYRRGPEGVLIPPGWRVARAEELARLGWTPPAGEAEEPSGDEEGGAP